MRNGMETVIKNENVQGSHASIFSWAIEYQCQICHAKYYSCKTCKNCGDIPTLFPLSRLAQHNQVYQSYVGDFKDFNRGKRKFALVDESVISGRNCGGSILVIYSTVRKVTDILRMTKRMGMGRIILLLMLSLVQKIYRVV